MTIDFFREHSSKIETIKPGETLEIPYDGPYGKGVAICHRQQNGELKVTIAGVIPVTNPSKHFVLYG